MAARMRGASVSTCSAGGGAQAPRGHAREQTQHTSRLGEGVGWIEIFLRHKRGIRDRISIRRGDDEVEGGARSGEGRALSSGSRSNTPVFLREPGKGLLGDGVRGECDWPWVLVK